MSLNTVCINKQLNLLFQCVYFTPLHVSINPVPLWPAYQAATYTEWYIPDDALIQLILLMMNTGLLETCTEVK